MKTPGFVGFVSAAVAAAMLGACGGGSDSSPPPGTATLAIAGTAARGAPLAGATVSVKCATGTPSAVIATTAGTGAYSVSIEGAGRPCVLRVEGSGGEVFHSVIAGTGTGGTFTANLTPFTEMMVAQLAGAAPGSFFDGFGSSTSVTSAALSQALTYVKSALAGVGDLGTTDPISTALAAGDAQDQLIDATMAALTAAGLTLESATAAIVANPAAPTVLGTALTPPSAGCAWLRSGRYRVVEVHEFDPGIAQIDVATNSGVDPEGEPFTMSDDGGCRFTIDEPDWTTRLLVSSAGVIVVQGTSKTTAERNLEIALPEQTLPLSEFAGTWNAVSWEQAGGGAGFVATVHEVSFDATGQATAMAECTGTAACVPRTGPLSRLVVNPAGGFDEILTDGSTWARVFLHKTPAGQRVALWTTPEKQLIVAVPKGSVGALAAVGSTTDYRAVTASGSGAISDVTQDTDTVTAVDVPTRAVTRSRSSDNRADTLRDDAPRDGLRHRALNACTLGGVATGCAELIQLPLPGAGLAVSASVGSSAASAFLTLAVDKPAP